MFLFGCCIGHWHGRCVTHIVEQYQWTHFNRFRQSSIVRNNSNNVHHEYRKDDNGNNLDDNGWRTIHVFYGKSDMYDNSQYLGNTSSNNKTNSITIGKNPDGQESKVKIDSLEQLPERILPHQQQRWFSQARQDELVIGLLRNKTNGYFIDLAANDAVLLSNTFALEKHYHWNGICIEPNPIYWQNLSSYRSCMIVAAVVGAQRMEEIYFRFEAGDHGGIANDGFNNGKRWQRQSERRYTVTLLEILRDRARAPTLIDYLSLDVEGAETFIMQNFPLDLYRIKIITAERLRGPIRQFLKDHGYEFITRITKWGESLWVHSSYRDELDWSVLDKYSFPLQ
jgi:Methyltransferase FkbM domain